MFWAYDIGYCKVWIEEAEMDEKYYCPFCGGEMIQRHGEIVVPHFAHRKNESCNSDFDAANQMSEWHIMMQNHFSKKHQEVIWEYDDRKHIADIMLDKTVIEFQHSPMNPSTFLERTEFWVDAGFRIAWVFDITDRWLSENDTIVETKPGIYHWKRPLQTFEQCDPPQFRDFDFTILLSIEDEIYRINWARYDYDDELTYYDYFSMDLNCNVKLGDDMNTNQLWWLPSQFVSAELKKYPRCQPKFNCHFYGKKGFPRECYICPLKIDGEETPSFTKCSYCVYNALQFWYGKNPKARKDSDFRFEKLVGHAYCCYPVSVHESTNPEMDFWYSNDVPEYVDTGTVWDSKRGFPVTPPSEN